MVICPMVITKWLYVFGIKYSKEFSISFQCTSKISVLYSANLDIKQEIYSKSIFSCANIKINFREKEKEVLDQILGPGRYDARIRPSGVNGTGKCTHRSKRKSVYMSVG